MEKVEEGDQGEEVIGLNNQVAKPLPNGRNGVCFNGWIVESFKKPILNSPSLQEWEENLGVKHLPEIVFGHSSLVLHHIETGIKIYFNAFNALSGWKQEALPPVEVPAAAKWKFRSKPPHQVILDYDYTFTTPYCGSATLEPREELTIRSTVEEQRRGLSWEDCDECIDISALGSKEPIVFFDERVMPSCWFLLLRFWLRVDGVLMRLRDTRVFCTFSNKKKIPTILRECCWRECKLKDFSAYMTLPI